MDKNHILYEKIVEPIQLPTYTKSIKIIICCLIIILLLNVIQKVFKIDNLEDKYYYKDKLLYAKENEKIEVEHITRRVFKYDDFYDTKKLIDEDGNEFKLNEEDTKFLKERGAK